MAAFSVLIRMLEQRLQRQEASVVETKSQLDAARGAEALAAKKP